MFFETAFLIYVIVRAYCHLAIWVYERIRLRDQFDTVLYVIGIIAAVVLARVLHERVLTAIAASAFADIVLVQGRTLLDVVSDLCKAAVSKASRRR